VSKVIVGVCFISELSYSSCSDHSWDTSHIKLISRPILTFITAVVLTLFIIDVKFTDLHHYLQSLSSNKESPASAWL